MPAFEFGAGEIWGTDFTVTPNVPVRFGALQGATVDFEFTQKELHSSKQFPVAIGRGLGKVTGKAESAQISGAMFSRIFFNLQPTTGMRQIVSGEAATVPALTPFTITVANATGFLADLGVRYSSTQLPLTPVAASPAVGQYTVNTTTGVYTFNASDASAAVLIDYTFSQTTSGKLITITNQLLGATPQFRLNLRQSFNYLGTVKEMSLQLNACMSSKLGIVTKLTDFTIPSFDFQAFADSADIIGYLSTTE